MKKRQVFILSCLFGLLILTGYLNMKFTASSDVITKEGLITSSELPNHDSQTTSSSESSSFFADFKVDRESVRNAEIANLDAIINDKNTSSDVLNAAQEEKMAITTAMEQEVTLEGLITSKGFSDAVVTIRENSVNVVVAESEISEQQAAQILDIVKRETGQMTSNIKIMPKN